jgi:anthranilate synthase component I
MATLQIVTKEKLADTETPASAYMRLCRGRPDSFLLESTETHETVGRYSVVGWDPICELELHEDRVSMTNLGQESSHAPQEFFDLIRRTLRDKACEPAPSLPTIGSLVGFVGYDAVRLMERLPPNRRIPSPIARLVFPSRFVVFDHVRRLATLVGIAEGEAACRGKIREIEERLHSPLGQMVGNSPLQIVPPPRDRFVEAVRRAKEYIRDGDIFQVVLSDQFEGEGGAHPFDVYRWLRVRSPSPYMFFLDHGDFQLVGASPETLVKVKSGTVKIRPIAGTTGRSADPQVDQALEEELLASEKERAEHIMLVDLARNDAGRVCRHGSISVAPFMSVERFSHVMHIVSEVSGELREDSDALDAFIAGFPAGTVSGAPKVRAMEIIDKLEPSPRGPYAGAVGYFGPKDEMDTCIAIRMVCFRGGGFNIRVGAGIVADSDPEMEYDEIQHKAAQSIAALQRAAEGEG